MEKCRYKGNKATSSSGRWGKYENTHTCTWLSVHAIRYDKCHDRTQARVRGEREILDDILDGTAREGFSEMMTFELRNKWSDRVNHKISNLCKLRTTFLFRVSTCICIRTCTYVYRHMPTKTWMWKSEDNLQEDLSLYGVSPRDWTQVVRLGSKYLYLPNHLVKHLFNEQDISGTRPGTRNKVIAPRTVGISVPIKQEVAESSGQVACCFLSLFRF